MKISRRNLLKAFGVGSVAVASGVAIAKETVEPYVTAHVNEDDLYNSVNNMDIKQLEGITSQDTQWKFKDWGSKVQYQAGDIVEFPDGHIYSVIK